MQFKKLKNKILITTLACVVGCLLLLTPYAIFPKKYHNEVLSAIEKTNLDENLIFAIIKAESSFRPKKISHKGAIGLMQIMPETAEFISKTVFLDVKFDLENSKDNILLGVTYLLYLIEKFENIKTALAAYNAGEGRVSNWLNNRKYSSNGKTLDFIPYKETEIYLKRVTQYTKIYSLLY